MISLTITFMNGARDGETLTLSVTGNPPTARINRLGGENAIELKDDPEASRKHAMVVFRSDGWWIEDEGSRNGTFVGEFDGSIRVSAPVRLAPNQVFRVGLTRFRLDDGGDSPTARIASAVAETS